MLNRKWTENEVRDLFGSFGPLEEVILLKDAQGKNRGCAFVTFVSKSNAFSAIKALHSHKTVEVRFLQHKTYNQI